MGIEEVVVGSLPPDRFSEVLEAEEDERFRTEVAAARSELEGRVVWNVNSTPRGGGVAEMLRSLLAYSRGAGVDARWVTIGGDPDFFTLTKRLHNHLHGATGDGGALGEEERKVYERVTDEHAHELVELVRPGDIVIVHDPQPAGLCGPLERAGAIVVWRCHIGLDEPGELIRGAWDFLRPYVLPAHAFVFSRISYAWDGLPKDRIEVIPPSIDAFSAKNQEMSRARVDAILATAGLIDAATDADPIFRREDGTPGRVDRTATIYEDAPCPSDVPIVLQVSRWDRLKDPIGVIEGFARHVPAATGAHLIYAGPSVEAVADDPEGAEVLNEAREAWAGLPGEVRGRIHLACLPMEDGEENAALVNALQRRADIVVQKSLAEGFGLTVAEAMWKSRPVVASRIGGIRDQIDEDSGVLIDDPHDLESYASAVAALLGDAPRRERLGKAAKKRVRDHFLGARHLIQYIELLRKLIGPA